MSRLHRDLTIDPRARQARRMSDLEDGATARLLPSAPRTIGGWVFAGGEIVQGGGFTVVSSEEGKRKKVIYNKPFLAPPVVVFSAIGGGGLGGNLVNITPEFFELDMYGGSIMARGSYAFSFFARESV